LCKSHPSYRSSVPSRYRAKGGVLQKRRFSVQPPPGSSRSCWDSGASHRPRRGTQRPLRPQSHSYTKALRGCVSISIARNRLQRSRSSQIPLSVRAPDSHGAPLRPGRLLNVARAASRNLVPTRGTAAHHLQRVDSTQADLDTKLVIEPTAAFSQRIALLPTSIVAAGSGWRVHVGNGPDALALGWPRSGVGHARSVGYGSRVFSRGASSCSGPRRTDPLTFTLVPALFIVVAALASQAADSTISKAWTNASSTWRTKFGRTATSTRKRSLLPVRSFEARARRFRISI